MIYIDLPLFRMVIFQMQWSATLPKGIPEVGSMFNQPMLWVYTQHQLIFVIVAASSVPGPVGITHQWLRLPDGPISEYIHREGIDSEWFRYQVWDVLNSISEIHCAKNRKPVPQAVAGSGWTLEEYRTWPARLLRAHGSRINFSCLWPLSPSWNRLRWRGRNTYTYIGATHIDA